MAARHSAHSKCDILVAAMKLAGREAYSRFKRPRIEVGVGVIQRIHDRQRRAPGVAPVSVGSQRIPLDRYEARRPARDTE
jgi:hypothetical protein